ncbi:hypothetical protein JCGZ_08386 [Jatropha curcas]|uniref:Uncharacterized protein n=1 Tax=Jatropha curcas TaxID=180498 RepID=A0A067KID1_JATCU|nr:hypothetical protein JCGZ_08386 [Jatropha curcas]
MEVKIGKFFESVADFITGTDQIPWCDRDIVAEQQLYKEQEAGGRMFQGMASSFINLLTYHYQWLPPYNAYNCFLFYSENICSVSSDLWLLGVCTKRNSYEPCKQFPWGGGGPVGKKKPATP